MSKQIDALKLALAALEKAHHAMQADMAQEEIEDAITAIKAALAQPEQEPVAAYLEVRRPNGPWQRYNLYSSVAVAEDAMRRIEGPPIEVRVLPLYTIPPKREWVGLTEEDFQPMVHKAMAYYGYNPEHSTLISGAGFYALVRNIEAKLKENNS